MGFKVTHGYVTVPTAVSGGVAHIDIRRGAMLPEDVEAEYVEALLKRGHIIEVDDEPAVDEDGDGVPDGTAAQILAWVGDDVDKAKAALDAENAKEKLRAGLVADLTKLIPAE